MKGHDILRVSLELAMIINDAGLREDNDYVNKFPMIVNDDLTRLDKIGI